MDWQLQRGIAQLIIGCCCLCFAASMFVRSWRRDRLGWPVPWRMLVSFWIGSTGLSFLVHAWYWLHHARADLSEPLFVYPLWLLAGLTVWTFWRWLHDDPMDGSAP